MAVPTCCFRRHSQVIEMSLSKIVRDLQAQISKSVYVETDNSGRHRIATPFAFGDGDQPVIVLVPNGEGWMLSDSGSTLFRLGFQMDDDALSDPDNARQLNSALLMAGINCHNDELTKPLQNGDYAGALFDFVHALLKIDELGDFGAVQLSRVPPAPASGGVKVPSQGKRPDFRSEVSTLVSEVLPHRRVSRNWYDPEWDSAGEYQVDFKVNGMPTPLFLHALSSPTQTRDATITVYRFNDRGVDGRHIAIFRDEKRPNQKVRAKLEAVCDKSFSNLNRQSAEFKDFLRQATAV